MASQSFTLNIKAVADMQDVVSNISNIQNALNKLKLPENLKSSFKTTFNSLQKELDNYQRLMSSGFKNKGDANALTKSGNNILRLYDDIVKKMNSLDNSTLRRAFEDMGAKEVEKLRTELTGLENDLKSKLNTQKFIDFGSAKDQLKEFKASLTNLTEDAAKQFKTLSNSTFNTFIKNIDTGRLDLAAQNLAKIKSQVEAINNGDLTSWYQKIEEGFNKLQSDGDVQNFVSQINQVKQSLTSIEADTLTKLVENFKTGTVTAEQFQQELNGLVNSTNQWGQAQAQTNRELDQVKSRVQYFLGLNNAINLVKRAIRGAVDTIKELDKAMTATAVVTDYTIKDMWSQLPEYTKRANELGVTTKDAYEAATLYFQQGLNADQAAALSTETLKMARIAGLDAAEATDRMTNALRGFNMALDERSAQRVDDVYSQLAAHTASNVDEISTAMTKVASLAHNANMEFETTAAFLAQIIETTRESAETAGTALKTVVARFSEVKKLVGEDQLKGTDEEGQVIDVNKVSAALRTAGIDMNKYFLGEVGLDDIFIELASKWDTLTAVQQRYIATQAAGSRQQSRFIALMQDYARTQELVNMAYDAEGASAKQFEKTQDSLQSKLARLKNAWNQFLMGLTNNVVVKGFIDLLTTLLNTINNLTSAFGEGTGSVLKWVTAISAFAGVKKLFSREGFIDRLLMTMFSGTGIGNAAVKSGLLSGASLGSQVAQGSSIINGKGLRLGLFGGFGNLGKNISKIFNLTPATKPVIRSSAANTGAQLFGNGGINLSTALFGEAGAAIPAGTIAGFAGVLAALEIGAIALQDYYASGKAQVKKQEKVTKKQEEQVEESKDLAQKQREAYEAYIKNEKIAQSATGAEKAQAEASMAEAISTLYSISSQNVIKTDQGLVVDKGYALDYIQTLEDRQRAEEATLAFEEAKLALAQKQVAEGKRYTIEWDETTGMAFARAESGSIWEGAKHNLGYAPAAELEAQAEIWNKNQTAEAEGFEAQARQKITEGTANLLSGVFKDESLIESVSSAYATIIDQESFSQKSTKDIQSDLDDLMHIAQDKNGKLLLDVLNGSYEGVITDEELQSIFNKIAPQYQETLKSLLVKEGETIEQALSNQNKKLKRSQFNFRKKAVAELYKSGLTNIQLLDKITNKLTISEEQKLLDFVDQWSGYGKDFNETLLTTVADAMLGGTWEGSDLQSFITNIGENPVQAFDAISKAADNSGTEVDKLAQKLLQLNEAQFSRENQVQWFLASGEFENLNDQIDKFIEANGEVTSHNIESLAAECSTLGTLLENDVISAKALAAAINALSSGNVDLFDLNARVLDLFENFESVTSIISRAGQFIKDFDPGEDWGDAYDFIGDATEKMTEFINNRELGNPQLRNYWKAFFTTDPQDLSDWEQGVALLKEMQGMGGGDFWTKAVGFSMDENGIISDMGLDQFAASKFGSYRDYIKSLAESRGYTDFADTYYDLMIRNMGNHDYGVITDLAAVELNKIVTAFGDGLPDKTEIQALADAYGIDPQDILDAWSEKWDPEGGKLDFNTLEDKIRKTTTKAEDLFTQFLNPDNHYVNQNEAATWNIDKLLATMGIGADGTFSLDTLKLQIGEVVPEVKDKSISIEDWFNEQVKANGGKVTLPVEYQTVEKVGEDQYQTKTITAHVEVENLEEYEAATKQLQDAANQEILGASLAGSLGEARTEAEQISNILANLGGDIDLSGITISLGEAANSADAIGEHLVSGFALGANAAKIVDQAVEDIPNTIDITAKYEEVNRPAPIPPVQSVTVIYKESNKPKLATGGIVGSYAKGSENFHVKPGTALTGEEGPEIVWNKNQGYAYVTGSDGPEFQNLQPGDRVFNASETKRIFKNSSVANGAVIDSFGKGTIWGEQNNNSNNNNNSGGGNDKEKTSAEWKNELDWLYNLMEDIVELERDQKDLEEQFQDVLSDETKTSKDLYNLLVQRLGNLNVQLNRQTLALQKREQEMREFMDTTNDQDEYLWYNWQDRTIEINWNGIDQITDGDLYKHVKELVSKAEEIQNKMDDAEDAITDIKNQIQELENVWRDTYVDFEKRVLEALVASYQEVIDNYSELNDALTENSQDILDAIQKELDLERQIRDNTQTEDDINKKQARLAYLKRDTTGANATEILKLQKEIEDNQEDYQDNLIDQAVQRLQDDNDASAKQRDKQIEIMQAQLDYSKEAGEFNEQVTELISSALSPDGTLLTDSDLYKLLSKQENWSALSAVNKQIWEEELTSTFKEVGAYLLKDYAEWTGEFYTQVADAINTISDSYTITVGDYSQPRAGGENGSGSGGGGGGGGSGGGGGGSGSGSGNNNNSGGNNSNNFNKDLTLTGGHIKGGSKMADTIITMGQTIGNAVQTVMSEAFGVFDNNTTAAANALKAGLDIAVKTAGAISTEAINKSGNAVTEALNKGTSTAAEAIKTGIDTVTKSAAASLKETGTISGTITKAAESAIEAATKTVASGINAVKAAETSTKAADSVAQTIAKGVEAANKTVTSSASVAKSAETAATAAKSTSETAVKGVEAAVKAGIAAVTAAKAAEATTKATTQAADINKKTTESASKAATTAAKAGADATKVAATVAKGVTNAVKNVTDTATKTTPTTPTIKKTTTTTTKKGTIKAQKYATGGLNTQQGPAWLDGTLSEPEYVLNARQTQAFLKLADVLPNVMSGNSTTANAFGNNIYLNLDMHVDEIGSDYDVDRIADRVKDILYNASSYRNVNTINFIR